MSTQSKEPMVEDSVMSPWATHKQRLQGTAVLCLGVSLFCLAAVGTLPSGWLGLSALLLIAGGWWLWQQGKAATISPLANETASTQHHHHPDTMQLIREATDSLDEALMIFDVTIGRFVHVSPGYLKLWQREPQALLDNPSDWMQSLSTGERWQLLRSLTRHRHDRQPYRIEFPLHLGSHQHKWVQMRFYPEQDGTGQTSKLVILADDITAIRQQEERLRFEANHDALTGLPNHKLLRERLALWLESPPSSGLSLYVLDIDHLKQINDVYGHAAGDQVLREFAERLCTTIPADAMLSRLSSDEFALIYAGQDGKPLAERLLNAMRYPFIIDQKPCYLTISLGWSHYPRPDVTVESLLREADMAMRSAKQEGRNRAQNYTQEMGQQLLESLKLGQDLLRAVNHNSFEIYYQPIYELSTGRLSGAEALLRWQRQPGEWISPQQFIPQLEESRLIIQLTDWLLWETGRQLKVWRERWPDFTLSVNVSGLSLQDERLLETANRVRREVGFPASALELEVTETAFIADPEQACRIAGELQDAGFSLAQDDFGTGYSSLISLQRFAPNRVKIDRSFIRNVMTDSQSRTMVESILLLVHKLGMDVVAEGVETDEQLALLRELGCDYIQGFYSGRPLPVAAWQQIAEHLPSREFGFEPRQLVV